MKKFNAKLLLFGEYGLMFGAMALGIPFSRLSGSLEFAEKSLDTDEIETSRIEIERFISYFEHHGLNQKLNFSLNLKEIKNDLAKGLYFKSDIPPQYGVGSSAALCAAIYDRYGHFHEDLSEVRNKKNILNVLKNDFSEMEAYFHGKSSGFDPLVSFINHSVLYDGKIIQLPEMNIKTPGFSIYLVDTETLSLTAPLVNLFVKQMNDPKFEQHFREDFIPANDLSIQYFLKGNTDDFFQQLKLLCQFQLEYFPMMFPDKFLEFAQSSLANDVPVKLLGSGGGGFLLAFVKDGLQLPETVKSFKVGN
jgi:mevalonate kinase